MLKSWLLAVLLLSASLGVGHAQQALAPSVVQELKAATVYVKTDVGPIHYTGSGFVIRNEPDYALIVTNNHVIAKPKELEPNGFIPGLRGKDAANLRKLQAEMAAIQPKISVVFNSGEANELTVNAQWNTCWSSSSENTTTRRERCPERFICAFRTRTRA